MTTNKFPFFCKFSCYRPDVVIYRSYNNCITSVVPIYMKIYSSSEAKIFDITKLNVNIRQQCCLTGTITNLKPNNRLFTQFNHNILVNSLKEETLNYEYYNKQDNRVDHLKVHKQ